MPDGQTAACWLVVGGQARYVTRLPSNDLGDYTIYNLRPFGVDLSQIVRGGDRMGVYFIENGALQRGSKVLYDSMLQSCPHPQLRIY